MMRPSALHSALLLCSLLVLASSSFQQGYGRELGVKDTETVSYDDVAAARAEGIMGPVREMIELDYDEPGANTNPRNGFITSPPPSPPAPF